RGRLNAAHEATTAPQQRTTARTRTTPKPRPTRSPPTAAPCGPRRPPRSPTTSLNVDGQVLSIRGELGYVVTDVNGELSSSLPAMLRGLHETGRLLTFPSPMRATPGDGSERCGTRSVSVLDDTPL